MNYTSWLKSLKTGEKVYACNDAGGKLTLITGITEELIITEFGEFSKNDGKDINGYRLNKGIYIDEERVNKFYSCFIENAREIIIKRRRDKLAGDSDYEQT